MIADSERRAARAAAQNPPDPGTAAAAAHGTPCPVAKCPLLNACDGEHMLLHIATYSI
jgi:hypothetical protein